MRKIKEFIQQATERAELEEKKVKKISLTKLEEPVIATVNSLSKEALEYYRSKLRILDPIDSQEFIDRFLQQDFLNRDNGKLVSTGTGLILFGKEPRLVLPQAGLLGTIHYKEGEEIRDFDGPMIFIPYEVEKWLKDKLPNVIDRTKMSRGVRSELPFEPIREGIINALVHRDYEISGAKCQVIVNADAVVIKSPGCPLPPISLSQLQELKAPILSRNPRLHYVFARLEMAEERGLGMKTLRTIPEKYNLPLPKYSYEDPYLILTIYIYPESASNLLDPSFLALLTPKERSGWDFVATKLEVTRSEYAVYLGIDDRKAQRQLKKFVELRLLLKKGAGPSTVYQIVQS